MSGYLVPVDAPVSADWQDHRDRTPPSSEPGTDYACAYGTPVVAPFDGTVIEIKTTNSGGMGRFVALALTDGRATRAIHLSVVRVSVGQRVTAGQTIGISGASGYGSDWYYGPHVHQTLWPGGYWQAPTIDFELYVGEPEPQPGPEPEEWDDDMPKNSGFFYTAENGTVVFGLCNLGSGFFNEWSGVDAAYNNAMAAAFDAPTFAPITAAHRDVLARDCEAVRAGKK